MPSSDVDLAGMNELDIARGMSLGGISSPQRYENIWLWAMRITGTGVAYRASLNEYVYRDKDLYLTDDFLARSMGLPVVWQHPTKSTLDSKEYADRVIGSIMLPYLQGEEVWGIAKIYDDDAARLMNEGKLSTSPAVVFRDQSVNSTQKLKDGTTLLIEGKPSLLDHLAICDLGVWDKEGPPVGVQNDSASPIHRKDSAMTDEEMAAADKARKDAQARADADAGQKLDKLLTHMDAMMGRMDSVATRMDAMEAADKARKDAMAAEEAEKMDKARKDRARKDSEEKEEFKKADADNFDKDEEAETAAKKKHTEDGDTEEVAADKARKARKDAMKARKDAAEEEAKKADTARADSQSVLKNMQQMQRELDELKAKNAPVSDTDSKAFADAQFEFDRPFTALGSRAPGPMSGETPQRYTARLARELQKHSKQWEGIELHTLDAKTLGVAAHQIRADAMHAARTPQDLQPGQLREIINIDPGTGQRMSTFVSNGDTFIHGMKRSARRVSQFNTKG